MRFPKLKMTGKFGITQEISQNPENYSDHQAESIINNCSIIVTHFGKIAIVTVSNTE